MWSLVQVGNLLVCSECPTPLGLRTQPSYITSWGTRGELVRLEASFLLNYTC